MKRNDEEVVLQTLRAIARGQDARSRPWPRETARQMARNRGRAHRADWGRSEIEPWQANRTAI